MDWWVARIGLSAGLAAAAPRFAGVLADRVPLQAALGASAQRRDVDIAPRLRSARDDTDIATAGTALRDVAARSGVSLVEAARAVAQALPRG